MRVVGRILVGLLIVGLLGGVAYVGWQVVESIGGVSESVSLDDPSETTEDPWAPDTTTTTSRPAPTTSTAPPPTTGINMVGLEAAMNAVPLNGDQGLGPGRRLSRGTVFDGVGVTLTEDVRAPFDGYARSNRVADPVETEWGTLWSHEVLTMIETIVEPQDPPGAGTRVVAVRSAAMTSVPQIGAEWVPIAVGDVVATVPSPGTLWPAGVSGVNALIYAGVSTGNPEAWIEVSVPETERIFPAAIAAWWETTWRPGLTLVTAPDCAECDAMVAAIAEAPFMLPVHIVDIDDPVPVRYRIAFAPSLIAADTAGRPLQEGVWYGRETEGNLAVAIRVACGLVGVDCEITANDLAIQELWDGLNAAWEEGPAAVALYISESNSPDTPATVDQCMATWGEVPSPDYIERYSIMRETMFRSDNWVIPFDVSPAAGLPPAGEVYFHQVEVVSGPASSPTMATIPAHSTVIEDAAYFFISCTPDRLIG